MLFSTSNFAPAIVPSTSYPTPLFLHRLPLPSCHYYAFLRDYSVDYTNISTMPRGPKLDPETRSHICEPKYTCKWGAKESKSTVSRLYHSLQSTNPSSRKGRILGERRGPETSRSPIPKKCPFLTFTSQVHILSPHLSPPARYKTKEVAETAFESN